MKSSEVSIKTRSASLTIQGQVTKDTTVKWSINLLKLSKINVRANENPRNSIVYT